MKLPFKMPSLKMLKKLGRGKKSKSSDESDEDDEVDEVEDDEDEESKSSKSSKKGLLSGLLAKLPGRGKKSKKSDDSDEDEDSDDDDGESKPSKKGLLSGLLAKLPKFGKKKSDDDDDDDDFDPSDFGGVDDAPAAATTPSPADEGGGKEGDATPSPSEEGGAAEGGAPEGEASGPSEDIGDMDDIDFGEDGDEDEDGAGGGKSKRKKLIIMGGAAAALLLVGGGAGWYFLSGDGGKPERDPNIPVASIDLPPPGRTSGGGSLNAIAAGDKGPGAGVVVPVAVETAFADMRTPPANTQIPAGPSDESMLENSPQGPLPKIADDGSTSREAYARPFDNARTGPRLAVIVSGLGASKAVTQAAIDLLPGAVTLAFDAYAPDLDDWATRARDAGHEVLISIPLEPDNFPAVDPGPQALMTFNAEDENRFRLEFLLSRMTGYVGVMTTLGSKFNLSEGHVAGLLEELKIRGLMYVEGVVQDDSLGPRMAAEMSLPRAVTDLIIDEIPSNVGIDAKLAELSEILLDQKATVIRIGPYPVSIRRLSTWLDTLAGKNIDLAPVTALADRQKLVIPPTPTPSPEPTPAQ